MRVKAVREALQGTTLRGKPLGKWLSYISAAADAGRHLTSVGIIEAMDSLNALLGGLEAKGRASCKALLASCQTVLASCPTVLVASHAALSS